MDPNIPSQSDYASWGQDIGFEVDPTPSAMPLATTIRGQYVELRSPTDEDLEDWWKAFAQTRKSDSYWTYMLGGPYRGLREPVSIATTTTTATATATDHSQSRDDEDPSAKEARAKASFLADCKAMRSNPTHCYYAIVPLPPKQSSSSSSSSSPSEDADLPRGIAQGVFSLFRPDLPSRCIELGHVMLGPELRGTRAATEAFYLAMQRVFEGDATLGKEIYEAPKGGKKTFTTFRRLEWKCNDFNRPSKSAALRLGFSYEGLFRQHMIVKARSRDTAWFSLLDSEWPLVSAAFRQWLAEDNFHTIQPEGMAATATAGAGAGAAEARQKVGLREIRQKLREQVETQQSHCGSADR